MAHSIMKALNIALLFFFCPSISLAFQSMVLLSSAKSKHHKITSCGVMCLSNDDDCLDHNSYMDESTYDKNHRYVEDAISRRNYNSRRSFLSLMTIAATSINFPSSNEPSTTSLFPYYTTANAAETIGKDESCNGSTCLGVWDGLLAGKSALVLFYLMNSCVHYEVFEFGVLHLVFVYLHLIVFASHMH